MFFFQKTNENGRRAEGMPYFGKVVVGWRPCAPGGARERLCQKVAAESLVVTVVF